MSSSSSSGSQGPADRPASTSPSASEQSIGRELLERVLQKTAENGGLEAALDAADREALFKVANRHRGSPLSLDPVAVELTEAILQVHFPDLLRAPAMLRDLAGRIAQAMLDDPTASRRLEDFWNHLSEVQP